MSVRKARARRARVTAHPKYVTIDLGAKRLALNFIMKTRKFLLE